jgi:hypothetical protein
MLRYRGTKIYPACDLTDMRKAINGLAAIVEMSFGLNMPGGILAFAFRNKCRDILNILEWDGNGFLRNSG